MPSSAHSGTPPLNRRPGEAAHEHILTPDADRTVGGSSNLAQTMLPARCVALITDEREHRTCRSIDVEVRHDIDRAHRPALGEASPTTLITASEYRVHYHPTAVSAIAGSECLWPAMPGRRIESRNRFVDFETGRYVVFEIPRRRDDRSSVVPRRADRRRPVPRHEHHVVQRCRMAAGRQTALGAVLERDSRRDEQTLKRLLESTPSEIDR
jgi:hypothetical protein